MISVVPIIYTGFGWVLGFLSTLVLQWINRRKRKKDFRLGLCVELKEAMPRLAGTYWLLKEALGELDRKAIDWTYSIFSEFAKDEKRALKSLDSFRKKTDEDLKALALSIKASNKKKKTMSVKKLHLPFLQSNLPNVSLLSPASQRLVAAIQRNVDSLNEEIDLYSFYLKKTFDGTLSEENYSIVNKNIDHAYGSIAGLSYKTAELISRALSDLSK